KHGYISQLRSGLQSTEENPQLTGVPLVERLEHNLVCTRTTNGLDCELAIPHLNTIETGMFFKGLDYVEDRRSGAANDTLIVGNFLNTLETSSLALNGERSGTRVLSLEVPLRANALQSENSVNGVAFFLYTIAQAKHEIRPGSTLNHICSWFKCVAAEAGSINFDVRETERV
ncbi:hypothetical protein P5F04_16080, partial [Clostridium perfringens]|nr:hypothetical protein [Clostridium perfringens]